MLRGNVVTGVVTVVALSSADFYRMFQGRVSGAQVFKNVANTASGVAGGTLGWMGGAAAGAAVGSAVPVIGTAIGGIVGGILGSLGGGVAAGKVSSMAMDAMIVDDSKEMLDIIGKVFSQLAEDYLLSEREGGEIMEKLQEKLTIDVLRDMYQSQNHKNFATNLVESLIVEAVKKRKRILLVDLPTNGQLGDEIENVLEGGLAV